MVMFHDAHRFQNLTCRRPVGAKHCGPVRDDCADRDLPAPGRSPERCRSSVAADIDMSERRVRSPQQVEKLVDPPCSNCFVRLEMFEKRVVPERAGERRYHSVTVRLSGRPDDSIDGDGIFRDNLRHLS